METGSETSLKVAFQFFPNELSSVTDLLLLSLNVCLNHLSGLLSNLH